MARRVTSESLRTETERSRAKTVFEYEIRVAGLVPESVLIEIEGAQVVVEPVTDSSFAVPCSTRRLSTASSTGSSGSGSTSSRYDG